MKSIALNILAIASFLLFCFQHSTFGQQNYWDYHQTVIEAEKQIAAEDYQAALNTYKALFKQYDFAFRKDYQIATQLAWYVHDKQAALQYLKKGIEGGWQMKYIKGCSSLNSLRKEPEWKQLKANYKKHHAVFQSKQSGELGTMTRKMSRRDQWMAFKGLFAFSPAAQDRYGERKFAPHSEIQMKKLRAILDHYGYPGEQLVGDEVRMGTILGHHNSLSSSYVQQDTIYPSIRPALLLAIGKGQLSPYEFAIIEDWRIAVGSQRKGVSYGFLNQINTKQLEEANQMRKKIAIRSVALRNKLVAIEKKTGMYFFLAGRGWVKGEITVAP